MWPPAGLSCEFCHAAEPVLFVHRTAQWICAPCGLATGNHFTCDVCGRPAAHGFRSTCQPCIHRGFRDFVRGEQSMTAARRKFLLDKVDRDLAEAEAAALQTSITACALTAGRLAAVVASRTPSPQTAGAAGANARR